MKPFGFQLLRSKSYLTGVNELYSLRSLIHKQKAPNALFILYIIRTFFANFIYKDRGRLLLKI